MAEAGLHLLRDVDLRREISQNAACDAAERFTIERQVAEYMDCYNAILARVREVSPRAASLG
jgi:glycosyltransferase involved in cell wall biosynthesis